MSYRNEATHKDLLAVKTAMENLAKTLKFSTDAEIKSKDRVDISLEEYESLKKENQELKNRCAKAEQVFRSFKIEPKLFERIDPDNVRKAVTRDLQDYTAHIRIEFDVFDYELGDI